MRRIGRRFLVITSVLVLSCTPPNKRNDERSRESQLQQTFLLTLLLGAYPVVERDRDLTRVLTVNIQNIFTGLRGSGSIQESYVCQTNGSVTIHGTRTVSESITNVNLDYILNRCSIAVILNNSSIVSSVAWSGSLNQSGTIETDRENFTLSAFSLLSVGSLTNFQFFAGAPDLFRSCPLQLRVIRNGSRTNISGTLCERPVQWEGN